MEKKKFNVVDVLVILVIIAAVAFVGSKFIGGEISMGATSTYEVRFLCEEVPDFAADAIKVGDKVLDEQKETNLGVVEEVYITDSRAYGVSATGEMVVSNKPNYKCVEIVAKVNAEDYEYGMISGSSKYGVGHSITIRVGKAKIFGRVSGIEKLDSLANIATDATVAAN